MSNDPKQPFDAPPGSTPSILQKDMDLDRRNREVPGFNQLRTRPTAPMAPVPPPPARQAPPSPTEWANRQAAAAVPPPARASAPLTAAEPEALGASDSMPTRIAPYNLPGAEVPAKAKSSGTPWKMRDPSAPIVDPAPSAPPLPKPAPTPLRAEPMPVSESAPLVLATVEEFDPLAKTLSAEDEVKPSARPRPAPRAPAPPPSVAQLFDDVSAPGPAATRADAQVEAAKPVRRPAKVTVVGQVHATPAGLFRRSISWVVDLGVISTVVGGLLMIAITVISPGGAAASANKFALLEKVALPAAALAALIAFVYSALFAFLWQGRTFGRRFVGIHLVDGSGSAPGPVRALFRAMLSVVSFALFLAGFWLALFDRKGQTLHDKLSRTFVVRLGADAS